MGAALVFLNLVPLLTPHVNLGTTLDAMTSTTSAWFDIESNISLGRAMSRLIEVGMPFMAIEAVVPIVIGLIVVRRQSLPMAAQWVLLLSIGVLALPVSWPQYLLALVPVAMVAAEETRFDPKVTALLGLVAVALSVPVSPTALYAVGLGLAVLAFVWVAFAAESGSSGTTLTPMTAK